MYYIGSMQCDPRYLEHHGIPNMKWGVRRFQNEDGSLTPEGRRRYGNWQETRGKDIYEKQQIRRMNRAQRKMANARNQKMKPGSKIDTCAGELKAKDVYSEDYINKENKYLNKRIDKQNKKYQEAKANLDRYHNASAEEQKKARNSIRLKRAGMVAAGAALTASIAAAALANNEIVKRTAPTIMKNLGSGKGWAVESAPVRDVVMENLGSGKGWTPVDLTQRYITKYTYGRNAALAGGAAALLGGASLAANKNRTPMTRKEEARKKKSGR